MKMMPFKSLVEKIQKSRKRREQKATRQHLAQKKKVAAPQVIPPGEAPPQKSLDELAGRGDSEHRSSTNSMVFLVMIGVVLLLALGVYFLVKSLGNPAVSEYPTQLEHRDSARDLEAGLG